MQRIKLCRRPRAAVDVDDGLSGYAAAASCADGAAASGVGATSSILTSIMSSVSHDPGMHVHWKAGTGGRAGRRRQGSLMPASIDDLRLRGRRRLEGGLCGLLASIV